MSTGLVEEERTRIKAPSEARESPIRLKVAYLVSRYPAISHTFILREVLQLRKLEVDVETISINLPDRPNQQLSDEELKEAGRTYSLKAISKSQMAAIALAATAANPVGFLKGLALALQLGKGSPKATLWRLFYLFEALLVGSWMQKRSVRHLHVHFATPAATVALLTRAVFNIPFSMTVHGPDEFYNISEYHLREKIEAASFICTIGHYCRSQLMKLSAPAHWSKIVVAPLGVDAGIFHRKREHAIRDACFHILCVGRLVPAKGQAVLLEAVQTLRNEGRWIRLRIAGDGPDRQRLEAAVNSLDIGECCEFLGAVNPDQVRALYEAADLFVLPSFAEGIPVVLMEAMAMEVPCVSTFVNGIPELIDSGSNGLLVAPANSRSLATAITRLIEDRSFAEKLGRAGRQKVLAEYDLSKNVTRLREVFSERIAANPGGRS